MNLRGYSAQSSGLFSRYFGDTAELPLMLRALDTGAGFDPTGHTLLATFKAQPLLDSDVEAVIQKSSLAGGFRVIDTATGRVNLLLVPADFATLDRMELYYFDVKAQRVDTGAVTTVFSGTFQPVTEVTRTTTLSIPTHTTNPDTALEAEQLVSGRMFAAAHLASCSFVSVTAAGVVAADAANNLPAHGFTLSSVVPGGLVVLRNEGSLNGLFGLVPGTQYFLSGTLPGQVTATVPAVGLVQSLGIALLSDTLLVEIDPPVAVTNDPTLTFAQIIAGEMIAAEPLAAGSFIALTAAGLVPANAATGLPASGFVLSDVALGGVALIRIEGSLSGFSSLTPGARYYLSDVTPGGITGTLPASGLIQPLGLATTPDTLLVDLGLAIALSA